MSERHDAIPPPPRRQRKRSTSPLPLTLNDGVPWKTVAWGLGLFAAMAVPTGTTLIKVGAAQEQLAGIRAEVSGMRSRQEALRIHVASLAAKADHHELQIERTRERLEKLREERRQ